MAATVDIALAKVENAAVGGAQMPVIAPVPLDTDLITTISSSQQSDFAVPAGTVGAFWVITATGDKIRAKFGADPTAVAAEDGGWLILDGQTREFSAVPGHKVAVITA